MEKIKYSRHPSPEMIRALPLAQLLDLWEITENLRNVETPIVRGWLMDELEGRNPTAFNSWMDQDTPEDRDLRRFMEVPQ